MRAGLGGIVSLQDSEKSTKRAPSRKQLKGPPHGEGREVSQHCCDTFLGQEVEGM